MTNKIMAKITPFQKYLKPCVYCGSKDIRIYPDYENVVTSSEKLYYKASIIRKRVYYAVCSCGDCTHSVFSIKEVITEWNNKIKIN